MPIPFTKMHGLGNDFVFLDGFADPALALRHDLPELAVRLCDRHTGVGADGLIVLSRPQEAAGGIDVRMQIVNADGSEGGMCGNGARCAARLVLERCYLGPGAIDTLGIAVGGRIVQVNVRRAKDGRFSEAEVDMGEPVLELEAVPVDSARLGTIEGRVHEHLVDERVGTFVAMGNPHMVCFVNVDPASIDLAYEGPRYERHPAFPRRINVHFALVRSRREVVVRTWERGAGATRACGSGACAVIVAGVLTGRLDREVGVRMPGGELRMRWDEGDNRVRMTGPAEESFRGVWSEEISKYTVQSRRGSAEQTEAES